MLLIFSKVFERVIHRNSVIKSKFSRFPGFIRSCEYASQIVLKNWKAKLNNENNVDAVIMYLCKGFIVLNYKLQFEKLEAYCLYSGSFRFFAKSSNRITPAH